MPNFFMKQSGHMPAFFTLPDEILEEIVSELDQHKDLVSLALTSRICAASVIPHHTQYRILRVRHSLPEVWAHLARRSDLARNIREIHICERHNYGMPDHYPTTLIDPALDRAWDTADESNRVRNICMALGHMYRLRVFDWSWRGVPGQQRPTSHPTHENAILTAVNNLPALETLSLNGKFALHALNSMQDPKSLTYPVWKVSNLRSLTLSGDTWAKLGNSRHLCAVLAKSPNLEYLEVPLEFHHLAECHLPKLKQLKLLIQAGANLSIDQSRALFLQNHPTIEELNWSPIGNPWIPPAALPNLKSLTSNRQFIMALDDPHYGTGTAGNPTAALLTPPSTPVSPKALRGSPEPDLAAEVEPEIPRILRPIESLDILSLDARALLDLKCLDRTCLRKLRLHTFRDISTLYEVAEAFPNIEWLSLPSVHLPSDSPHPMAVSMEQWLDILPRFKNLQVFRGQGLWESVKNDMPSMHQLILELVQVCPHLAEIDHCDFYEKFRAQKRVVITRHGDSVDLIGYRVGKPEPRYPLDVMDGAFA
jgi:hypothetical protein